MGAWQLLCCASVIVAGNTGPNFLCERADEAREASWLSGPVVDTPAIWSMPAHDKAGERRCLCGVGACIFVASEWCAAIIAVRLRSGVLWLHGGRRKAIVKIGKKGRGLRYMYRYLRLGDRDDVFWDQASTSTASSS